MLRHRLHLIRTSAVALALAAAAPAFADIADEAPTVTEVTVTAHRDEKVTVSATKSNAPLIETPQSVSVLTREMLDLRGVQTLNQALRYTAGVTSETRGGVVTRYDQFVLRGFDQINNFLDGLQQPYGGWYAFDQVDASTVERIDVLKGPGSVLYGATPPGGFVNFSSKTPPLAPQGELEARLGTNNLREINADLGGPIAGPVSGRLVALYREGDGQAVLTQFERTLIAPSLRIDFDPDTQLTLLGRWQSDPKSASYGGVPAVGSTLPNPLGKVPTDFYDGDPNFERFDRESWSLGYIFEKRFGETFTLRQNARYNHVVVDYGQLYGTALLPDNRTLARATAFSQEDLDAIAVDTQGHLRFETGSLKHEALFGFDYQRTRLDGRIGYGAAPSIDLFAPVYGQAIPAPTPFYDFDIEATQKGFYLQDQVKLGGLVAIGGVRRDQYEKDQLERLSGQRSEIDQEATTGRVGVLYHFASGFAPYASWSTSFEPVSGTDVAGQPFDPMRGEQFEVGLKYEDVSRGIYVAVSAFDLTRDKALTADPANPGFSIQGGELTSRGVELEANARVLPVLEAQLALTVLDLEYTKDNDGLLGKTPVGSADRTASLWLTWRPAQAGLAGLTLSGGVRYVGETWGDAANTFKVDPYTLFDLSIQADLDRFHAALDGWRADLTVSNLFDNDHVSTCYSVAWCWYGAERQVQVGLKRAW
ncbi:TonB-dependent siderophore receptor [Phenylobacterium sp.]|uniref:TonB-dependent siderophore receptor n=1 Tax=Phenylobacterium sp. TaxID=1871053 RepID=UPI0035AF556B